MNVITDIASRRRKNDALTSVTFVFGGVNYGTVSISAPYVSGKPILLYLVPQQQDNRETFTGPLDCLVTDERMSADQCGAEVAQ